MGMMFDRLLEGIEVSRLHGDPSVEILDLAYDSRKVTPGSLFFAVPGLRDDGRQFVAEAVRKGARAVVAQAGGEVRVGEAVLAEVGDVRKVMARIAARFFGEPSRRLALVGVTGTNGKTTFTYLMESILDQAGCRPGVIGTILSRFGDRRFPSRHTTPESVDLQRMLHQMVEEGATHALLEVSSHGLDFRRVDACRFACAVFTNLGRDHLDHHGTLENYFASKARLFTEILPEGASGRPVAVVNCDDPYGRRLLEMCPGSALSVGKAPEADYRLECLDASRSGLSIRLRTPKGAFDLESPLLGEVNAQNVALAAAASDAIGIPTEAIVRGVARLRVVPGRLERVTSDEPFLVLVDYAHTPDALEKVLASLRRLGPERILTVFGCGGDRDRGKRPLMGAVVASWSDLSVVTSDNPRSEPPGRIIEEILQGVRAKGVPYFKPEQIGSLRPGQKGYTAVEDRRQAIRLAVAAARAGDVVLVAGKGHEEVQIVGSSELPFQDRKEVLEALEERRGRKPLVG